jgi:hypothetical protein
MQAVSFHGPDPPPKVLAAAENVEERAAAIESAAAVAMINGWAAAAIGHLIAAAVVEVDVGGIGYRAVEGRDLSMWFRWRRHDANITFRGGLCTRPSQLAIHFRYLVGILIDHNTLTFRWQRYYEGARRLAEEWAPSFETTSGTGWPPMVGNRDFRTEPWSHLSVMVTICSIHFTTVYLLDPFHTNVNKYAVVIKFSALQIRTN